MITLEWVRRALAPWLSWQGRKHIDRELVRQRRAR